MRPPLTTAVVAAIMAAASSAAAGPCPPEKLASFDLSYTPGGKPVVPIDIGGHRVNLKVDTGGLESMLSDETVRALNLPRGTISNYTLKVGSDPVDQYTTAQNVVFGGRPSATMRFLIMPPGHLEKDVGGTLGPNILRQYGVEFDFGGGKLNLFSTAGCTGSLAYWTHQPHSETPVQLWRVGPVTTKVTIAGRVFTAIVDTGSAYSSMPLESAQRQGIVTDQSKLTPLPNLGDGYYAYRFNSVSFENGPVVTGVPLMLIRHDQQDFNEDMVLGMDILRQFHIYFAYGRQIMFMTPASTH